MWSTIICLFVYNLIYSASNSSRSKGHLNIDVRMYGSFRRLFLLMKSIGSSQYLTSVYVAWSWFGDRKISLPIDTRQITTINVVFGNSGRLLLALLLARSPKSVAGCLLSLLPLFLAYLILLAHGFKNISTHCRQIHSALWKLSKCNQVSNVSKNL